VLAAVLERREMLAGYEAGVLLPKITCPVLLLQADPQHGAVLTDGEIEAAQRLARVEHVRLRGIGHPLHGTHPAEVLAAIAPFVDRLTASR
jgi:pimeloyl-ACP methyl ester carboxylesterase